MNSEDDQTCELEQLTNERIAESPVLAELIDAVGARNGLIHALYLERVRQGLSHADIARRMERDLEGIDELERGEINPSASMLDYYAIALGMRIDYQLRPVEGAVHAPPLRSDATA